MATYQVDMPDGASYQIDTPDSSGGVRGEPWSAERAGQVLPMVARQASQGLTANAGDEMIAATAAVPNYIIAKLKGYLGGDKAAGSLTLKDLYDTALSEQNQQLRQDKENFPTSSVMANIAGGALNAGATTEVLAAKAPGLTNYLANPQTRLGAVGRGALQGGAYGAVAGGMGADPTNNESRSLGAVGGGIVGTFLGGGMGGIAGKNAPKTKLSDDVRAGILENDPSVVREKVGEDLGFAVRGAARTARDAKDAAYNAVGQVKASLDRNSSLGLAKMIDDSVGDFDAEIVPAVKSIQKYTSELKGLASQDNVSGIKYGAIEGLRKRLNAIPYTQENSAAKTRALVAFDKGMNDLLENGLIRGDESALALIQEARSKNAYYMQKFVSKEANRLIRQFVKSEGTNLSPQQVADAFTRASRLGIANAKTAKELLGEDAIPLLKQGALAQMREASLDKATGQINSRQLAVAINQYVSKNSDMANQIFTKEEIGQLNALSATSARLSAKGGFSNTLASRIPILSEFLAPNTSKQLANPSMTSSYRTPMSFLGAPQ